MPAWSFICINAPITFTGLAVELNHILEISLARESDNEEIWYHYSDDRNVIELFLNTFENDRDMYFENYAFFLRVRTLMVRPETNHQERLDYTRLLYEKLKATGRYSLLFVDDLQIKIDEFISESK